MCDVPVADHAEKVRLYPGGQLCDWHSPWAQAGRPAPAHATESDQQPDATSST